MNALTLNCRPVAAAVIALFGLCAGSVAHAALSGDEGSPLSLTLDHQIKRDSNISRTTAGGYDTQNVTGLRFGLDKAYGRQQYRLAARVARTTFERLSEFNNNSSNVNGSFSTGIASNWLLSASGTALKSQVPFEENNAANRVVKNEKDYRDGRLALQYGVSGLWALVGSYDSNRLRYSNTVYQGNDADQSSTGFKVKYFSTDLLEFGLGGRQVETDNFRVGRIRTDQNLDFSVDWQVTGLSYLNAVLTRRQTSYNTGTEDYSGWGGSLSWNYRPQGLLVYNLYAGRSTSADREVRAQLTGGTGGYIYNLTDSIATSVEGSVSLRATEKTSFSASYGVSRFEEDNDVSLVIPGLITAGGKSSSYYREFGLSVNYKAMRSVGLGCSYSKYSQTLQRRDISLIEVRPKYDGNSFGCSASFTLDL